jgi:fermentation-respiration switch protein FrsA (DUF1100 family)
MGRGRRAGVLILVLAAGLALSSVADTQTRDSLTIRGHAQTLRVYGARGGQPVIVSSGDGGWIHLGPHVAETLAAKGFFVVGFDVKAYLESFTSGPATLAIGDEPRDYAVLAEYAGRGGRGRPILIGVSEGAGLSVLAATDPGTKPLIAGVIGLGLPDFTELGWRWKDAIIYLTHANPREPGFSAKGVIDRVAPVPLAAIHATRDEFVPLAEAEQVIARAREPKRLWVIEASDHRFSDALAEFDQRLLEAIAWVDAHAAAP